MSNLPKRDATCNCEAAAFPSTGSTREWWRDQSRADRTDWISLLDAADTALQRLRAVQPSSLGHVITDSWKKLAVQAWDSPSWREAAREHRAAHGGRVLIAEIDPGRLQLLRRLSGDDTAPEATCNAAVYELRTHGLDGLSNPACQRRLADLSAAELRRIMVSLQQRRGSYPHISDDLLTALAQIYGEKVRDR
jgi:hypothetical protein